MSSKGSNTAAKGYQIMNHELELPGAPFKPVHEQKAVSSAYAALSNKYSGRASPGLEA
jgi:hypothetical protein